MRKECQYNYEVNLFHMNRMADRDVRWIGTVLNQMNYNGECACPQDTDSDGNRCGGRSAFDRSGGASPMCYPEQIADWMLPQVRHAAAMLALSPECGGSGYESLLRFPKP